MTSPDMASDRSTVKQLKELFVSGLSGGSIQEINIVTIVALSSYAAWCALQTRFSFFSAPRHSPTPSLPSLLVDFLLNWVILLLSITVYAPHPFVFNLLILAPVVIVTLSFPSVISVRQRTAHVVTKRRERLKQSRPSSYLTPHDTVSVSDVSNHLSSEPRSNGIGQAPDSSLLPSQSFQSSNSHDSISSPLDLSSSSSASSPNSSLSLDSYIPKKSFLTNYRGGMMVITCIAILAVDFRIFPRRFAKVETWGTSLMDLGVGSFVFSMGLVSARGHLKDRFLRQSLSLPQSVWRSIRQATSVLLLGLIRLVLVKAIGYHEHTSEYGVHWNFFMTLGFLPPFVTALNFLLPYISSSALSLGVGILYQVLLDFTPLTRFILTAPRTGIISQNKEGIFSFFGYLSIFLAGQTAGFYTLPSTPRHIKLPFINKLAEPGLTASNPLAASRRAMLVYLVVAGLSHAALFQVCIKGFKMNVSRRIANLPYVLWVTSYNLLYILMYLLVEVLFFPVPDAPSAELSYDEMVPWGLEAINKNGLAIFLLANVLTGLVNMAVNTLEVRNLQALALLLMYSGVLAVAVGAFRLRNWHIRI
ncbi:GWT1-domain-containing protein [Lipomyces oligophaga]|uniref:GWT1-domain-containing protein n=1 Tax=Lipomyces oligophaga TaxID=45792 RepID=UPI0034CF29D4